MFCLSVFAVEREGEVLRCRLCLFIVCAVLLSRDRICEVETKRGLYSTISWGHYIIYVDFQAVIVSEIDEKDALFEASRSGAETASTYLRGLSCDITLDRKWVVVGNQIQTALECFSSFLSCVFLLPGYLMYQSSCGGIDPAHTFLLYLRGKCSCSFMLIMISSKIHVFYGQVEATDIKSEHRVCTGAVYAVYALCQGSVPLYAGELVGGGGTCICTVQLPTPSSLQVTLPPLTSFGTSS